MRLRLTDTDLRELARLYRGEAAANRRQAEQHSAGTQAPQYIEAAMRDSERAEKLERLATVGRNFILQPAAPFNGGPPSLLIVGGSDTRDGSAFVPNKRRA